MKYLRIIALLSFLAIGFKASSQLTEGASISTEKNLQEIMRVNHILQDEYTLDSIVEQVYASSGLLKSFDEEILMYEEEKRQKKRNWVSSFRFGVNIFSAQTTLGADDQSITTYGLLPNVGITMAVDPEKLVNRGSYVRQAENKRDRSMYLQQDHKQRLKKEILGHYYDYLTLLEALVIKNKTLEARRQHLHSMEVEFRNGNATIQELLIVQNQVYLMEEDLMKANLLALKNKSEIAVIIGLR